VPIRLLPATCAIAVALAVLPACEKKPNPSGENGPGESNPGKSSPEDRARLDNLRKIAEALHSYAFRHGEELPSPIGVKKPDLNAKPLLSWRVHILPNLNEEALYKQFKLDEPWDSPTNKALIEKMPKVYQNPSATAPAGQTFCKVFVGPGACFDLRKPVKWASDITDGTSNTILAVEADPPVIWTKPEDIPFDPNKPLPALKLNGSSRINVLTADGGARTIDVSKVSEKSLKAAITANAGDFPGDDWNAQDPTPTYTGTGTHK
jgi:hypothetical protein